LLLFVKRSKSNCLVSNEIIADNLSKVGWSLGCVSALDSEARTIWIADAHRDDGKRYVVHADEKLTAFLGLQVADSHHCRVNARERAETNTLVP
jgi:hypothetical protein